MRGLRTLNMIMNIIEPDVIAEMPFLDFFKRFKMDNASS
jgi:hypothetical protein